MRIVLIGGLERAEQHFERLAREAGHEVLFHDGRTGGRGAQTLTRLCERCDVVIVLTDVNSHGGVQLARRVMRELGREVILLRRISLSRFAQILAGLGQPLRATA